MEAYLDNSATTRCCEEAAQLVVKLLTEDYGNPSSLHNKGVIAENYMNDARKKIAKTLKVQEKEICFTSGGTESNNLAIIGSTAPISLFTCMRETRMVSGRIAAFRSSREITP